MTPAKPKRQNLKSGVYRLKAEIKRQASRRLDRRRTLDRAVLDWEECVVADLGGRENLTTLQLGILRALAWDRLFLDSAAVMLAEMRLVNKRDRKFYTVVMQRAQLEDSFARRAAQLGLERRAKPVVALSEYLEKYRDNREPEPALESKGSGVLSSKPPPPEGAIPESDGE